MAEWRIYRASEWVIYTSLVLVNRPGQFHGVGHTFLRLYACIFACWDIKIKVSEQLLYIVGTNYDNILFLGHSKHTVKNMHGHWTRNCHCLITECGPAQVLLDHNTLICTLPRSAGTHTLLWCDTAILMSMSWVHISKYSLYMSLWTSYIIMANVTLLTTFH